MHDRSGCHVKATRTDCSVIWGMCTGEADRPWFDSTGTGARDVDHVVTTAEMAKIIKDKGIDLVSFSCFLFEFTMHVHFALFVVCVGVVCTATFTLRSWLIMLINQHPEPHAYRSTSTQKYPVPVACHGMLWHRIPLGAGCPACSFSHSKIPGATCGVCLLHRIMSNV